MFLGQQPTLMEIHQILSYLVNKHTTAHTQGYGFGIWLIWFVRGLIGLIDKVITMELVKLLPLNQNSK